MPTLTLFEPQAARPNAASYMYYVSQKDDLIHQESSQHTCQEVLLRWAYLEQAKKHGASQEEPYCFKGPGREFLTPKIQMILKNTNLAHTIFAKAVKEYIHPLEQTAELQPTQITVVAPHIVLLEADPHWAANSLSMSIWLQLMRTAVTWREGHESWLSYLHGHSYFDRVPTIAKLQKVWLCLPELMGTTFKLWCGKPGWTPNCGVWSQIYNATSGNDLGVWMWKNCWSKETDE